VEPGLVEKIMEQGGWSRESATAFVGRLPEFGRFMESVGVGTKPSVAKNTRTKSTRLAGQIILFTGFHPKDLEAAVVEQGAELADTFVKKLTMLVVKDETVDNAKTPKATAAGIPVKPADQLTAMLA
jgi:NAD-dependent DNA ligase